MVTWVAKPGKEQGIEQILRALIPHVRAEAGCLRYDVLRAIEDPRRFVLVEVYRDDAALQAHSASDHFKRYVLGEALDLLESRARVNYESLG